MGCLDYIYIQNIKDRFEKMLISIQNEKLKAKYLGIIICYSIMLFVIKYFVIDKNLSLLESFLLGSSIYGIYDMTNYATITNWDFNFAIFDILWGGTLFLLTNLVYKKIKYSFD